MKYNILDSKDYYKTYFIDDNTRPTIVIVPGGGYDHTSPRESEPVVDFYNSNGYHCIVVNYRENIKEEYPIPQIHLAYAINEIRKDKRVSKLIGIGFSAGGHNLLETALHYDKYQYDAHVDLLILAYPVVTSGIYAHKGSFKALLGSRCNDESLLDELSIEKHIPKNAPDMFLWGTCTDESVPVMNSLLLLEAYTKANNNCEYHLFPMGGHGLSVCTEESSGGNPLKVSPYVARWKELSLEWLKLKLK